MQIGAVVRLLLLSLSLSLDVVASGAGPGVQLKLKQETRENRPMGFAEIQLICGLSDKKGEINHSKSK